MTLIVKCHQYIFKTAQSLQLELMHFTMIQNDADENLFGWNMIDSSLPKQLQWWFITCEHNTLNSSVLPKS